MGAPGTPSRQPRVRLGLLLVGLCAVLLAGCRVDTRVSLVTDGSGSGSVSVTVTFDKGALSDLGGVDGLARQLSTADLVSSGWTVRAPAATPGGGASVTVTHGFSNPAEASQLLSDVAGAGPASARPFRVHLSVNHGFLHQTTHLSGKVDLTCGLGCFADQGLQALLGNPQGVDPSALAREAGEQPSQAFGFSFAARLPGSPKPTGTATRQGGGLVWPAALGQATDVSAESESLNTGNVVLVCVLGGALLAGLAAALIRWRRRRRSGDGTEGGGRGAHAAGRWWLPRRPAPSLRFWNRQETAAAGDSGGTGGEGGSPEGVTTAS